MPAYRMHMPRLLEGVDLPVKTISEVDIGERQLWHEYQGSRPNLGRNAEFNRKWKMSNNMKSTNSPPVVIMKGAGTGWGGSRGRIISEVNSMKTPNVAGERAKATYTSSSKVGHGKPENYFTSPMNCGTYNSNEKRKPSGFGRGRSQGIDENKSCTSIRAWRQSDEQNAAAPSSQAYSPWRPNQSSNDATSTWRRGQHEVYNSYAARWNSRYSDAASSERTGRW